MGTEGLHKTRYPDCYASEEENFHPGNVVSSACPGEKGAIP